LNKPAPHRAARTRVCDTSFNQRSPLLQDKQAGHARRAPCMKRKVVERRYFAAPPPARAEGGEALSRANDAEFSGQPRALPLRPSTGET